MAASVGRDERLRLFLAVRLPAPAVEELAEWQARELRGGRIVPRENLHITRDIIDKFYGDNGRYPASLDELVQRRYLRAQTRDPITESPATWLQVEPEKGSGVYDLHSGAAGNTRSGIPFGQL